MDYRRFIYKASKEGRSDIIKIMFLNKSIDTCLNKVKCENNVYKLNMFDYGIGNIYYEEAFIGACESGNIVMVNLFILNGKIYPNKGLKIACKFGFIDIANLMIINGATKFNKCLKVACGSGHMELVKLMISKDANDYESGLKEACLNGHIDVAKYMISLGVRNLNELRMCRLLEFRILYQKLTGNDIILPIKTEHLEYHLLKFYGNKIPDIDRLINKYLY